MNLRRGFFKLSIFVIFTSAFPEGDDADRNCLDFLDAAAALRLRVEDVWDRDDHVFCFSHEVFGSPAGGTSFGYPIPMDLLFSLFFRSFHFNRVVHTKRNSVTPSLLLINYGDTYFFFCNPSPSHYAVLLPRENKTDPDPGEIKSILNEVGSWPFLETRQLEENRVRRVRLRRLADTCEFKVKSGHRVFYTAVRASDYGQGFSSLYFGPRRELNSTVGPFVFTDQTLREVLAYISEKVGLAVRIELPNSFIPLATSFKRTFSCKPLVLRELLTLVCEEFNDSFFSFKVLDEPLGVGAVVIHVDDRWRSRAVQEP